MSTVLYSAAGDAIRLDNEVGRGGEGSVYRVAGRAGEVAKVYHQPPPSDKQEKLLYMVATGDDRLRTYIAWPTETLHVRRGGPVQGFMMPNMTGRDPLHDVYSPAHRRAEQPDRAWDFLLLTARNVAAAFDTLHTHGHVIGDVNQNGILVASDARVVLIDSDSFQISDGRRTHLCGVGVPEYTPPELQGAALYRTHRTPNHDNFGLSVAIFHLLFGGRHPFAGKPLRNDVGNEMAHDIRNFRYADSPDNMHRGILPPPRGISTELVPPVVREMFVRAFTEPGATQGRPTAQQWVAGLGDVLGTIGRCGQNQRHVYPSHLRQCPWCQLEAQGLVYFVDLGTVVRPTPSGFELTRIWALIEAIPSPPQPPTPAPSDFSPTPKPRPQGVPGPYTVGSVRTLLLILCLIVVVIVPDSITFILATLVGSFGWAATHSPSKRRKAERQVRRETFEQTAGHYRHLVDLMQHEAGPGGFMARRASLENQYREYQALSDAERKELADLDATAVQRQLRRHLDTCFIDGARIPGLGPSRKAALRSFGIETAADVDARRVMQVSGFGTARTSDLIAWRRTCEHSFRFDPKSPLLEADRNGVRSKYQARRVALEIRLRNGPRELQSFTQNAPARAQAWMPHLQEAAYRAASAEADLKV